MNEKKPEYRTIEGKRVKLPDNYTEFDYEKVYEALPDIRLEPQADRVFLKRIDIQTQFNSESSILINPSNFIRVESAGQFNKMEIRKQRYIVLKAGKDFGRKMNNARFGKNLRKGDEVQIAFHLDGMPHFPVVFDPDGIFVHEFISLHYTECVGFIRHDRERLKMWINKIKKAWTNF